MSKQTREANRQTREAFNRLSAVDRNMVRRGDTSKAADKRLDKLTRDLDCKAAKAGPIHKWAFGPGKTTK
jgi:hypothetical protein